MKINWFPFWLKIHWIAPVFLSIEILWTIYNQKHLLGCLINSTSHNFYPTSSFVAKREPLDYKEVPALFFTIQWIEPLFRLQFLGYWSNILIAKKAHFFGFPKFIGKMESRIKLLRTRLSICPKKESILILFCSVASGSSNFEKSILCRWIVNNLTYN